MFYMAKDFSVTGERPEDVQKVVQIVQGLNRRFPVKKPVEITLSYKVKEKVGTSLMSESPDADTQLGATRVDKEKMILWPDRIRTSSTPKRKQHALDNGRVWLLSDAAMAHPFENTIIHEWGHLMDPNRGSAELDLLCQITGIPYMEMSSIGRELDLPREGLTDYCVTSPETFAEMFLAFVTGRGKETPACRWFDNRFADGPRNTDQR